MRAITELSVMHRMVKQRINTKSFAAETAAHCLKRQDQRDDIVDPVCVALPHVIRAAARTVPTALPVDVQHCCLCHAATISHCRSGPNRRKSTGG